ncbi:MAG: phospholipase [Candidatus Eisenbacteria bacterium]|nr:phospholipase [Candidatus Eisenbacteria bacterium]
MTRSLSTILREAGGLEYRRITAATHPTLLVLLCHGYGAPGTDLVPIGEELIQASSRVAEEVVFLFPEAPLSLGGFPGFEQRAWWQIDIAALELALARGEARDRKGECPRELDDLRPRLSAILDRERQIEGEDTTLPMDRVIVGGFSQGAMLTTDFVLRSETAPGGLALLSGTLLCEDVWREAAPRAKGVRILQSHGRQDPLLPFFAAEELRSILAGAGADVRFVPFEGQHEIPLPVFVALRDLLHASLGE